MRIYPFAWAAMLLFASSGLFGAARGENDMCNGRTAEAMAAELTNRLTSPFVRVLVTLSGDRREPASLDDETAALAAALRREGALMAEPIGGQPLIVVEIDRNRLPDLARHPHVACIAEDTLGKAQ